MVLFLSDHLQIRKKSFKRLYINILLNFVKKKQLVNFFPMKSLENLSEFFFTYGKKIFNVEFPKCRGPGENLDNSQS